MRSKKRGKRTDTRRSQAAMWASITLPSKRGTETQNGDYCAGAFPAMLPNPSMHQERVDTKENVILSFFVCKSQALGVLAYADRL